jgi:hypothetical protein
MTASGLAFKTLVKTLRVHNRFSTLLLVKAESRPTISVLPSFEKILLSLRLLPI